jgi:transcription initiation factor TFIIE subunit beta
MSFLKANSATRTSAPSPTPSNASGSGSKRKRPEESSAVVYSQPQETGTGSHIYTQLTYAIEFLRQNQKWMTFKEIMEYLNVKDNDPTSRQHLTTLFRSNNPQNRISYNYKDNTYRYKPKFDIRNTAQLKGYFQKQKSSQGLSVKELKDGWANVHEDLKELEAKKEVLVKRNLKDQAARTVCVHDTRFAVITNKPQVG